MTGVVNQYPLLNRKNIALIFDYKSIQAEHGISKNDKVSGIYSNGVTSQYDLHHNLLVVFTKTFSKTLKASK